MYGDARNYLRENARLTYTGENELSFGREVEPAMLCSMMHLLLPITMRMLEKSSEPQYNLREKYLEK